MCHGAGTGRKPALAFAAPRDAGQAPTGAQSRTGRRRRRRREGREAACYRVDGAESAATPDAGTQRQQIRGPTAASHASSHVADKVRLAGSCPACRSPRLHLLQVLRTSCLFPLPFSSCSSLSSLSSLSPLSSLSSPLTFTSCNPRLVWLPHCGGVSLLSVPSTSSGMANSLLVSLEKL